MIWLWIVLGAAGTLVGIFVLNVYFSRRDKDDPDVIASHRSSKY